MSDQFRDYKGILCIGDPHLEGRIPGFRKDEYPRIVLEKIRWCLNYAREHSLVPVFLGDMFHVPRDNPNWLIVELLEMFSNPVYGIYGNHDVRENQLNDNDSLSILVESGRYRLLSPNGENWVNICGRKVYLGGSSWGQDLPESINHFELGQGGSSLCFWFTHHDIRIDGQYDAGDWEPHEIPGVECVVNGHIHRRLETVQTGQTSWVTPGNISRRKRDDATRDHVPSVFEILITEKNWTSGWVEIPHQDFETVFHEAITRHVTDEEQSSFVAGLAQLESLKTDSGQGLHEFLDQNLEQFAPEIATEIRTLAAEVTGNDQ